MVCELLGSSAVSHFLGVGEKGKPQGNPLVLRTSGDFWIPFSLTILVLVYCIVLFLGVFGCLSGCLKKKKNYMDLT